MIDGTLPTNPELREHLGHVQRWWSRACDVRNYDLHDPVLADEARFVIEWCISFARQIVDAERGLRCGQQPSHMLEYTAKNFYERLGNLEKGLKSNGVKRSDR